MLEELSSPSEYHHLHVRLLTGLEDVFRTWGSITLVTKSMATLCVRV